MLHAGGPSAKRSAAAAGIDAAAREAAEAEYDRAARFIGSAAIPRHPPEVFEGLVADGWADVGRQRYIANTVTSGQLRQSSGGAPMIDLMSFAPLLARLGVQVNVQAFPASTFVLRGSLKASVTVFQKGRVIVAAHTNESVLVAAVEYVRRVLGRLGFRSLYFNPGDFSSKNIVGNCRLPSRVSLKRLVELTPGARHNSMFNGVIIQYYRVEEGSAPADGEAEPELRRNTLLAFSGDTAVVVGVRTHEEFDAFAAVCRVSLYLASPAWEARRLAAGPAGARPP